MWFVVRTQSWIDMKIEILICADNPSTQPDHDDGNVDLFGAFEVRIS